MIAPRDPWTPARLRRFFSVWYCRRGRRWCWREKSDSPYSVDDDDVRESEGYPSRRLAWAAVRAELDRRRPAKSAPRLEAVAMA